MEKGAITSLATGPEPTTHTPLSTAAEVEQASLPASLRPETLLTALVTVTDEGKRTMLLTLLTFASMC